MANFNPKQPRSLSGQFAKMEDDPINADGPDLGNVLADGTGSVPVDYAYKVDEPVTGPTYSEHFGRSTRSNPHARRAVLIDAASGQKIFDISNDDLVSIARKKLTDAAGDSQVIRELVDIPTHVTQEQ